MPLYRAFSYDADEDNECNLFAELFSSVLSCILKLHVLSRFRENKKRNCREISQYDDRDSTARVDEASELKREKRNQEETSKLKHVLIINPPHATKRLSPLSQKERETNK